MRSKVSDHEVHGQMDSGMRKPTYRMIIIALAETVVAPPLSTFAQQGPDQRDQKSVTPRQGVQTLNPPQGRVRPIPPSPRFTHGPLPLHKFGDRDYHGHLAWEHGRWHHETRNGRNGWWWDVGGVWYCYPEPSEGPPDYVSDNSVAEEATPEPTPPPQEMHHTFYYPPGDDEGIPYEQLRSAYRPCNKPATLGCTLRNKSSFKE